MKPKIIIIISVVLLFTTAIIYDNFYTQKMISGRYAYNFPSNIVDGPKTGEYLLLKDNGTFESTTWGNGMYEINGSKLALKYKYEMGEAAFDCGIYRPFFFGTPRISIQSDLDYYFKKD